MTAAANKLELKINKLVSFQNNFKVQNALRI